VLPYHPHLSFHIRVLPLVFIHYHLHLLLSYLILVLHFPVDFLCPLIHYPRSMSCLLLHQWRILICLLLLLNWWYPRVSFFLVTYVNPSSSISPGSLAFLLSVIVLLTLGPSFFLWESSFLFIFLLGVSFFLLVHLPLGVTLFLLKSELMDLFL
jgi:hypothetical protein